MLDCRLAYDSLGVEIFEESTVIDSQKFLIDYKTEDSETPLRMSLGFNDFGNLQIKSADLDDTHACDSTLHQQKTYISDKIPVTYGVMCNPSREITLQIVFTFGNTPVRLYHKIN